MKLLRLLRRVMHVAIVNPLSQTYTLSSEAIKSLNTVGPGEQIAVLAGRIADAEAEGTLFAVITGGASQNLTIPWNCELCDMTVIPTGVQSGGTIQLKTSGGSAITDAVACAVVGTIGRMGSAGVVVPSLMIFTAGQVVSLTVAGASTAGKVTLNFKRYQTQGNTNTDGT